MRYRSTNDLLRLRSKLFRDAAVFLRGTRYARGRLLDLLDCPDDLGEPAGRALGDRFDPAHFGLPDRHRRGHLLDLLANHARRPRDVFGGAGRLIGELPHFFRDDRKAAPMLPRARGLDRGIESEQVGL